MHDAASSCTALGGDDVRRARRARRLTPTIGINGVSVSPPSGVARDFTNPVTYTVTAADNTQETGTYQQTATQLIMNIGGAYAETWEIP